MVVYFIWYESDRVIFEFGRYLNWVFLWVLEFFFFLGFLGNIFKDMDEIFFLLWFFSGYFIYRLLLLKVFCFFFG